MTVAKRATGQVFPEVDVSLRGRSTERTSSRTDPTRTQSERTSPYEHTLVVARRGGYWLVCGDRSDPRTARCVTTEA